MAIGVFTQHRNVFFMADQAKAKRFQSPDDPSLRGIDREL
jgi:hypothetical protein